MGQTRLGQVVGPSGRLIIVGGRGGYNTQGGQGDTQHAHESDGHNGGQESYTMLVRVTRQIVCTRSVGQSLVLSDPHGGRRLQYRVRRTRYLGTQFDIYKGDRVLVGNGICDGCIVGIAVAETQ